MSLCFVNRAAMYKRKSNRADISVFIGQAGFHGNVNSSHKSCSGSKFEFTKEQNGDWETKQLLPKRGIKAHFLRPWTTRGQRFQKFNGSSVKSVSIKCWSQEDNESSISLKQTASPIFSKKSEHLKVKKSIEGCFQLYFNQFNSRWQVCPEPIFNVDFE